MFDERWDRHAQQAVILAQEAARGLNDYVGSEHILMGLVREKHGVAAGVLASFGMTEEALAAYVADNIRPFENKSDRRQFTPRAEKTLTTSAWHQARELDDHYIGTAHILLAILSSDAACFSFFEAFDADRLVIRDRVVKELSKFKLPRLLSQLENCLSELPEGLSGPEDARVAGGHLARLRSRAVTAGWL